MKKKHLTVQRTNKFICKGGGCFVDTRREREKKLQRFAWEVEDPQNSPHGWVASVKGDVGAPTKPPPTLSPRHSQTDTSKRRTLDRQQTVPFLFKKKIKWCIKWNFRFLIRLMNKLLQLSAFDLPLTSEPVVVRGKGRGGGKVISMNYSSWPR